MDLYNLQIAYNADIENLVGTSSKDTIIGNDLPNEINGNGGSDVISGRGGADKFILNPGKGTVTIDDFNGNEGDKIGLSGGLTFESLSATQDGTIAVIQNRNTGEVLARLRNFQATSLTSDLFVAV